VCCPKDIQEQVQAPFQVPENAYLERFMLFFLKGHPCKEGAFVRKVGLIGAMTKELLQGKMLCLVGGGFGGRKKNLCVRKTKVFHFALRLFRKYQRFKFQFASQLQV